MEIKTQSDMNPMNIASINTYFSSILYGTLSEYLRLTVYYIYVTLWEIWQLMSKCETSAKRIFIPTYLFRRRRRHDIKYEGGIFEMKLRRLLLSLLAILVFIPGVLVFATRPTPVDQLHAGMFPVGSEQRVEYASALNVRRGPHYNYTAFTYLVRGNVVTVLEYRDKWIRVNTPRGEGWIYTGYLSREMAAAAPLGSGSTTSSGGGAVAPGNRTPQHLLRADMFPVNSTATVDFASHVNIRRGPGNSYNAFTNLARGTSVNVLEFRLLWVRVNTPSGEGWIFSGFLNNDAVATARASGSSASTGTGTQAGLGTRTPHNQLSADNFTNGSTQTVDYAFFLNVRRGPGTSHAAFTHLSRGTEITVLEFRSGWVRINTAQGDGWIYAGYLRRR